MGKKTQTPHRPSPEPESVSRLLAALDAAITAADDVAVDLAGHRCRVPADECDLCDLKYHAENGVYALRMLVCHVGSLTTRRRVASAYQLVKR